MAKIVKKHLFSWAILIGFCPAKKPKKPGKTPSWRLSDPPVGPTSKKRPKTRLFCIKICHKKSGGTGKVQKNILLRLY